ncbi:DUF6223 family protein [Streptomyces sp. NPDC053499]|uniref:DUF6223 family protein n=1 Tax=Streptomyces sp. NPDC053499 TaxID=3365707 RepID=UPI0037D98975
MSVRRLLAVVATAFSVCLGLAAPAAAHASVQPVAASVYSISLGRLVAATGAGLGLAGVVIAWRALARPAGRLGASSGPFGAAAAVVAGVVGMTFGGLVAATADGGLGTGNGLGGAYVALLVGLLGTALGGVALIRSRRTA